LNVNLKNSKVFVYLLFCTFLFPIGCKKISQSGQSKHTFSEVLCQPDTLPQFDNIVVQIPVKNSNSHKDTIIGQIKKSRKVFKPCRKLTFRTFWKNKNGELITTGKIKMMATGKRWEYQPEKQDELVIQYEYSDSDIKSYRKNGLNKGLSDQSWSNQIIEGVIENVEEVWMHPFRFNQYNFTEVAPFPEVKFPLQIGKTWYGSLHIMEGWGDWENSRGSMEYEVLSRENVSIHYGDLSDCWKIHAVAKYPFGTSTLTFWFHEDLGFVKKEYTNYGGQTLSILLEEVKIN
jgi:hypothetical protein